MVIIRKKDMRKMNEQDLAKKMSEIKLELAKLRGSSAVGAAIKNSGRVREIKRTIARMLTIKKETKKEDKK
jgi:large subunit ribosomal protein L29